jgi:hypothetical protein
MVHHAPRPLCRPQFRHPRPPALKQFHLGLRAAAGLLLLPEKPVIGMWEWPSQASEKDSEHKTKLLDSSPAGGLGRSMIFFL